jgi:hypothetical protein
MAVGALRMGLIGLAVLIIGLIVTLLGSTAWILAVGMVIWLSAVVVTLVGFSWAWYEVPEPRPSLWSMRMKLVYDAVHTRSSTPRP